MSREAEDRIAQDIFVALIGETAVFYEEETQIRSAPNTDSVDVLLDGQWYRISSVPIDEPISLAVHRDEVSEVER
jgi:hypothetical protein